MERYKKFLFVLSFCILSVCLFAALNRTGSFILFWKEEPLGDITHDDGYGYYAYASDLNISKMGLPFYLKEDETLLEKLPASVNEDLNRSIKENGGGAYLILDNNDIYFSASDNIPENHEYSLISPVIIRSRYLLVLLCLTFLVLGIDLILFRKAGSLDFLKDLLCAECPVLLAALLFPWNQIFFPKTPWVFRDFLIKPMLLRNPLLLGLLFVFVVFFIRFGKRSAWIRPFVLILMLLNLVYYFVPEWNYYGQRADSPAYLQHYTAGSIRTPGYPAFIESVYRLSGNEGLADLRLQESVSDESLHDAGAVDSHGLLNVVRAQKCVLGVSFLILFFVFSRYYHPLWFVFAAQVILSGGFLGVDNSYIMTECLSQAVLILAAAALIVIVKDKNSAAYPVLCFLCGIAVLIRPANIFMVIPLIIGFFVLAAARRNLLTLTAGVLIFLAVCAVPAVTIYRHYGVFVWMPTSGYVEIARAVDLMEPEDAEAFADPESRAFFDAMLQKKQKIGEADQNTYMWEVAVAAAEEMGYDHITCSTLFGKVSRKIFALHFRELAAALADTIRISLERTRLRVGPLAFPVLAGIFTVLFLLRINTDSLLGMFFMLMHTVHLCISMMNQPERRYIYSTEIICLLGWLLITLNFFAPRIKENIPDK